MTDSTGAVIPGATIELINPQTGLKLSGNANDQGQLNVPAVPAGTYDATITAQGFQSQKQRITVQVTENLTLNFHLNPGEANTSVNVSTAQALIDTTDATLGETIEGKQITELPLNGRNALNLALLTPGVTQGRYGESSQDTVNRNGESGAGALSVNGTRVQANNFILDGVDNNDGLQNTIVFFPPVEATQEFKVITNIAPAQYGRAGGALVISSLRSGTNSIHGSAFEYYRSGHFGANPNYRFLGAPATAPLPNNRNQFGGSVGFPIFKDKLFLFGDYSGYRESQPLSQSYITVPTPLMRQGNLSELLNRNLTQGNFITTFPKCYPNNGNLNNNVSANSRGQIFDPLTCAVIPGNIINPSRLNPVAVRYLNAFPLPTRTDRVINNFLTSQAKIDKYNTFDARLDWHPSQADILFARAAYDNSTDLQTSALGPALPAGSGSGFNYVHARGYVLGSTHTFSPRVVNEARLAYNRERFGYQPPNFTQNISADLGIVNANRSPQLGGGALIGGGSTQLSYTGDYGLFDVPENTEELTDTVNLMLGKHSLQFGGTLLFRQVSFFRPLSGKGTFTIASNGNDFTGYEVSELLIGAMDNYAVGSQTGYFRQNSQEDALFLQDDWRLSQRLTLNLGARWDFLQWPYEQHNQAAAFDANTGTVVLAGQNGIPRSITNQDWLNFAPRVGFAYALTPDGRASLHGGYGIFYYPDYGGISNQPGQQPPFGGSVTYYANQGNCITLSGRTASTTTPYNCGFASPAAVTAPLPAPGFPNFNPNAPSTGLGGLAIDRNNKHSRLQEYNVQLQQQFGNRDVVSIAYVGTYGDRLSSYYTYNSYLFGQTLQPFPNLGGISRNRYDGVSNYNGLQVHYEHRIENLTVTGSYAWSHALDNSPGAFQGSTVNNYADPNLNYGNSSQDVRHNFTQSAIYNLPFGRGQRFLGGSGRFMDLLVGGFQFNLVSLLSSGQPSDLTTGSGTPGNRPDQISQVRYTKQINSGKWFDPSSFVGTIPTVQSTDGKGQTIFTRVGTAGRNEIYGPSSRRVNFSVQKNLHLTDRVALELHGDSFNIFNTPQFTNPGVSVNNPSRFGVISGLKQNSARQIQIAGRLVF